jgi:hypothetical protein
MGRRYAVCKLSRNGKLKKRSCTYVVRKKNGTFKKWTNIGRSIKADSRRHSRRRPKKSGYGHTGDY